MHRRIGSLLLVLAIALSANLGIYAGLTWISTGKNSSCSPGPSCSDTSGTGYVCAPSALCVPKANPAGISTISTPRSGAAPKTATTRVQYWCQSSNGSQGLVLKVGRRQGNKIPVLATVARVAQTFRGTITRRAGSPIAHVSGMTWGDGRRVLGLSHMGAVLYWPRHASKPLWVRVFFPNPSGNVGCA